MTSIRRTAVGAGCLALVALAVPQSSGFAAAQAKAQVLYVDGQIGAECATYNASTRVCRGGAARAYPNFRSASAAARPGTTVLIRGGVYSEALVPSVSGVEGAPITFKNYEGESVTLSDVPDAPAIQLIARAYIVVEGFTVSHVVGWARLQDSHHVVIRGMTFRTATATGTTGGLKLVRSAFNHITDNRFGEGTDLIVLQDASDRNVVSGNVFAGARHSLMSVRCSSANILRGNSFANEFQKAIEIYDCEGVSDAPVRLDSTRLNLIEGNRVTLTRGSYKPGRFNAIQHGGQHTIVRRNVFSRALGGGVTMAFYAEESLFVYGNRLYHNTFYENRCFAIEGGGVDDRRYRDNRFVNNLLYKNYDCDGRGAQTDVRDRSSVVLASNGIESADPGFADERREDFRLAPGSRMIDRGAALTTTSAAGQGTSLVVADPTYFFDGFRIPGEQGDEIRLLDSEERARVVQIDYPSRTLTLDRPLTWKAGQGVALDFKGVAPDLGAFEFDPQAQPPSPQPAAVEK